MKRRELLHATAAFGLIAATRSTASAAPPAPLKPPVSGGIPVAFLVSDGAVIIDFCGPWEGFQDVDLGGRHGDAFRLYTVAETTRPIRASGRAAKPPAYHLHQPPPAKMHAAPPLGSTTPPSQA